MPMNALLRKGFGLGGRFDRALSEHVEPSFEFGLNEYWMEQALIESMNGVGITSPNPAVGCVIVQGNHEISRGHTQAYRKEHLKKSPSRASPFRQQARAQISVSARFL